MLIVKKHVIAICMIVAALLLLAGAACADNSNIFGIHFWNSGASNLMHSRQGYDVENLWPGVQGCSDWSTIRAKVQGAVNEGFTPIVRLCWNDSTSLSVPANGDTANRQLFSTQCAAAVVALGDLCHIWVIGNEMNMTSEGATPAAWYLSCFNGMQGGDSTYNCYTQIHNQQANAIVCMGPVAPWNANTNATGPYNTTYEKWKNYWYYLVNNSGMSVDGWAIHTYGGRTNGQPGNASYDTDPRDDCNAPYTVSTATVDVCWDFNCFRYFVDEVATSEGDMNKPIFITETNTACDTQPSTSYATGWMGKAYEAIDTYNKNHFQKIHDMSWFVYDPFGAWTNYALCCGSGNMAQAATDYSNMTSSENYQWSSDTPDAYVYSINTGSSNLNSTDPNQIVLSTYAGKYEGWNGSDVVWGTGGPAGQTNNWVMIQSRSFNASTAGTYTFRTTSSDGSWLYVDGKLVVNNSGQHSSTTVSGTVSLITGYHWVYVKFFKGTSTTGETAYAMQPPGGSMGTITDSHAPKGNALVYSLDTVNSVTSSTDFTQIVPLSYLGSFGWNGVAKSYGTSGGPLGTANNWIVMQPFVFYVAASGSYSFRTTSDDGSWIWIDGAVVVNNSGVHSKSVTVSSSVSLVPGWHVGMMKFFKGGSGSGYIYGSWLPPSRGGGSIYDPIPVY